MKHLVLVLLVVPFSGCLLELLTTTAIQGELAAENASTATRALDHAKKATQSTSLQRAINTYHAEKGAYPPSLDALVPRYIDSVPTQPNGQPYPYDPATGQLRAPGGQLNAITSADRKNMQRIQEAINQYGRSTGYYPPSLQALEQYGYLKSVPKTSAGEDFIFYPSTGALRHPAEFRASTSPSGSTQPQQRSGGIPTGGSGAMAETMTGIGIQRELGNMNNSGVSNAGSAARSGARGRAGNYSNRQMKTLRNLDLDR